MYGDLKMYGKTSWLRRIFTSRRGFILLPADVSLTGLDEGLDEC